MARRHFFWPLNSAGTVAAMTLLGTGGGKKIYICTRIFSRMLTLRDGYIGSSLRVIDFSFREGFGYGLYKYTDGILDQTWATKTLGDTAQKTLHFDI